jgi:phosphohistidine phosphatase
MMSPMADLPQLYLLRHAKAESGGRDHDHSRQITDRGRRQAETVGRWLGTTGTLPGLVWCSTATRARQTWETVAAQLGSPPAAEYFDEWYEAGTQDGLELLHGGPTGAGGLMVVGHNPTIESLAGQLTGSPIELGTGNLVILRCGQPWPELASATLVELVDPRNL